MPDKALDNAVEHLTLTENHEYVVCACQKRMGIFMVEWSRNRHENSAGDDEDVGNGAAIIGVR